jgi:lambda family phage minor tail protein L
MSDISQVKSILSLDPETYLELFDIYVDVSVGFLRVHSGKNFKKNIIYKGNVYISCPVDFSGSETNSSGSLPRPSITIANINGLVSDYIKNKNDLNNSSVKRTKVFLKNIDDVNFQDNVNPFYGFKKKWFAPNYGPEFFSDNYVINNKKSENKYSVELELSSPLDLENVFLPARKISDNLCSFVYRGFGCNYGKLRNFQQTVEGRDQGKIDKYNEGIPVADVYDRPFLNSEEYPISRLRNSGVWSTGAQYTGGDFVLLQNIFSYDFSKENIQSTSDDLLGDYYICISTGLISGNGTNPKFDRLNWVKDECSKTLNGCEIRWSKYNAKNNINELPFGGQPGTRPYEYRT